MSQQICFHWAFRTGVVKGYCCSSFIGTFRAFSGCNDNTSSGVGCINYTPFNGFINVGFCLIKMIVYAGYSVFHHGVIVSQGNFERRFSIFSSFNGTEY